MLWLQESDYVVGGERLARPVATPIGLVGLAICYDLRFPEHSLALTKRLEAQPSILMYIIRGGFLTLLSATAILNGNRASLNCLPRKA
jgi:predicted amidohydrolase